MANLLWGAPRIHGELLKLGIEISQATVQVHDSPAGLTLTNVAQLPTQPGTRYRCHRHARRPVRSISIFVCSSDPDSRRILYVFVAMEHLSRRVVHTNVTAHPTAGLDSSTIARSHSFRPRVPLYHPRPRRYLLDRLGCFGGWARPQSYQDTGPEPEGQHAVRKSNWNTAA